MTHQKRCETWNKLNEIAKTIEDQKKPVETFVKKTESKSAQATLELLESSLSEVTEAIYYFGKYFEKEDCVELDSKYFKNHDTTTGA